jgi:hypothetical protein
MTGGDFLCRVEASSPAVPSKRPSPIGRWVGSVSRDAESSELLNFPFVFVVIMVLFAGAAVTVCGMCLGSLWLILTGAVAALLGGAGYGRSLYDY